MNSVGINISTFANVVTPFSPVGKQAVGLENADAKQEVFAPVVEPSPNAAAADDDTETRQSQTRDSETQQTAQSSQQSEAEKAKEREQRQQKREDEKVIAKLAARDRDVRAHEQAHASVGGQYAGSPHYVYQRGPNGVNYAVGGEVSISLPRGGGNPEQTIAAAEQVRRAALAPTDPSAQDRRVAAAAASVEQQARAELADQQAQQQNADGQQATGGGGETGSANSNGEPAPTGASGTDRQAQEQHPQASHATGRRNSPLSGQLITPDSVQKNHHLGSVFDQRV